jgi:hypothetical protein
MITIKTFDQAADLEKSRHVLKYVLIFCTSGATPVSVDENEFILTEEFSFGDHFRTGSFFKNIAVYGDI